MLEVNKVFVEITDSDVIKRLSRSMDIMTIKRENHYEAVNLKNGNRYRVNQEGQMLSCECPDSQRGFCCKHEIAAARDSRLFNEEQV